jgi:hypothetical protein
VIRTFSATDAPSVAAPEYLADGAMPVTEATPS